MLAEKRNAEPSQEKGKESSRSQLIARAQIEWLRLLAQSVVKLFSSAEKIE